MIKCWMRYAFGIKDAPIFSSIAPEVAPYGSVPIGGFFITAEELAQFVPRAEVEQRERAAFKKGGESEREFIYHGIVFEFDDYLKQNNR